MYSLTGNLSLASQALNADTGALSIINNNLANANTQGYSRETVDLSAEALVGTGQSEVNGVSFGGFTSVRDQVLQIGINQKTSDLGSWNAQSAAWSQIESAFSGSAGDLGSSLSDFFSAFSSLATAPDDAATRQTAFSAAAQLVSAFHQAASVLSGAQASADASISGAVGQINQLSSQIATLDNQLTTMQAAGQDGGSVADQRDQLTTQLAQLVGISSTNTSSTPSLSIGDGSPLVIGGSAYSLHTTEGPDGQTHVIDAQGEDLTAQISGGSLGGVLTMRDQSIPKESQVLDTLAGGFAAAVNTVQSQGYDQNGNAGQPMFSVPAAGNSVAMGLSLSLADPSGLAISSDGSPGSSGNLANLLAIRKQALPSGQTPLDTYAGLTQSIGSASAAVSASANATSGALKQLTTQQASESGVSIDEETTNLLRFQQAYSAAAEVITTINSLFSIVLNMNTVTA